MFTVDMFPAKEPEEDCRGRWCSCTPSNIGGHSAVGYYFAREIHKKLGVPVGMLSSSVGGTTVEAWTPLDVLERESEFASLAAQGRESRDGVEVEEVLPYADPGIAPKAAGWEAADCPPEGWQDMTLPNAWQNKGLDFNGAVWFRKDVDVPAAWLGRDLMLSLGMIDDFDTTWFNGTTVGGIGEETPGWWAFPRKYVIKASLVREGRNTIAVRVFDQWCSGGLLGQANTMTLAPVDGEGEAIPLAGTWTYRTELELPLRQMSGVSPTGALYNGMIAPLVPYGMRGAIWYQGESNVDRAYQYRNLFRTFIRSWRSLWGKAEMPFLFVQLANFGVRQDEPQDSAWAELQEAQSMARAEPHTGMAVAIDVGDAEDIHPRNKRDVGVRLALCAQRQVYGLDVVCEGPRYAGMEVEGGSARIRFQSTADGLVARDGPLVGFALAGEDRKFAWAAASIDGDTVVLRSESVPRPVAVRYAWADNPKCNLYNSAGLPAEPFRTDDWPGVTAGRGQ
jgi:sialate O-acetylesterase